MALDDAAAALEHPNGREVWAALLTEFAAELQQLERLPFVEFTSESHMAASKLMLD